jgi:hypothetical protein
MWRQSDPSPFVSAGCVFPERTAPTAFFDHTSILKFLAERFRSASNGGKHSPEVDARPVESFTAVFDLLDQPRSDPPAPPPPLEYPIESTPNQRAFQAGVQRLAKMYPSQAETKFPELRLLGSR